MDMLRFVLIGVIVVFVLYFTIALGVYAGLTVFVEKHLQIQMCDEDDDEEEE